MPNNFFFLVILTIFVFGKSKTLIQKADGDDKYMHPSPSIHHKPTSRISNEENKAEFWKTNARKELNIKLATSINTNVAKNTILFLGDGMSIPTLTAARIYKGQQRNASGEEEYLSFEKFPYSGLSKTYCVNRQVADSACTATAYLCGVKNNRATIGVTADVSFGDCEASLNTDNHVHSIARWMQLANKRTGLVTTTRVTHASPAGIYAHVANRDWECDADVEDSNVDPNICKDIAYQAVYGEAAENLNVILGGGRGWFLPNNVMDEEGKQGRRKDKQNLIESWLRQKENRDQRAEYVWDRDGLLSVDNDTEYLLGLFENSHCLYNLESNMTTEPTLAEMTEAAIKILSKGKNGFFLFVEGGRIDHGHHDNKAKKALDETVQFAEAVERALNLTSEEDTLIVVTSDHAHTMSISGYSDRGTDIFGVAGSGADGIPYVTLSYANGPSYSLEENGTRHDVSQDNTQDDDYEFPSSLPLTSETHGGDDVGIFALGPWAHLFTGVVEQNIIPYAMAYASCVGEGPTGCGEKSDASSRSPATTSAGRICVHLLLLYLVYYLTKAIKRTVNI